MHHAFFGVFLEMLEELVGLLRVACRGVTFTAIESEATGGGCLAIASAVAEIADCAAAFGEVELLRFVKKAAHRTCCFPRNSEISWIFLASS